MILIGYKKCSTCQNAEKLLKEKGIDYNYREIDKEPPTAKELAGWIKSNGQPISKWLNTSGIKYRELGLAQKRKTMSDSDLLSLIATDGMLVKRPILLGKDLILVGPQVKAWLEEQ